jgi:hypothetical protein
MIAPRLVPAIRRTSLVVREGLAACPRYRAVQVSWQRRWHRWYRTARHAWLPRSARPARCRRTRSRIARPVRCRRSRYRSARPVRCRRARGRPLGLGLRWRMNAFEDGGSRLLSNRRPKDGRRQLRIKCRLPDLARAQHQAAPTCDDPGLRPHAPAGMARVEVEVLPGLTEEIHEELQETKRSKLI